MSQRIIVVDCDDVMINLRDTVIHALNHATGKNNHYRDFERFTSIGDDYGIGSKELVQIMKDYEVLENCKVEPYAKEFIDTAKANGDRVIMLSAREPYGRGIVDKCLSDAGIELDDILLVGFGNCKTTALYEHIGKDAEVFMFVDDATHNFDNLFAKRNVLIARPWNLFSRRDYTYRKELFVCTDLYEVTRLYLRLSDIEGSYDKVKGMNNEPA